MANATGTPGGVVSDEHHRLNQAGLIAPTSAALAARTGVMIGPNATALVTGTAATGTMTVNVLAHHWATSRGTADGVYLGTKEASTTVNIAAAPGSNSRIDVVYDKQNDSGSTITPDGSIGELYGVVTGTAAVSPTKPAIPVGAIEIATVTVAAGATSTNGAGVTIANTARLTTGRGGPIPFRTSAEATATAGSYPSEEAFDIQTKRRLYWSGSAWIKYGGPVEVLVENGDTGNSGAVSGGASATVVSPVNFTVPIGADTGMVHSSIAVAAATSSAVASVTVAVAGETYTRTGSIPVNGPVSIDFVIPISFAAGANTITVTLTHGLGGAVNVTHSAHRVTI